METGYITKEMKTDGVTQPDEKQVLVRYGGTYFFTFVDSRVLSSRMRRH